MFGGQYFGQTPFGGETTYEAPPPVVTRIECGGMFGTPCFGQPYFGQQISVGYVPPPIPPRPRGGGGGGGGSYRRKHIPVNVFDEKIEKDDMEIISLIAMTMK